MTSYIKCTRFIDRRVDLWKMSTWSDIERITGIWNSLLMVHIQGGRQKSTPQIIFDNFEK